MALGDIKKLNLLNKGMTKSEAYQILGEPKHTKVAEGNTILKYSLHEWMCGWKPIYLVFDEKGILLEWYVDEDEYMNIQKIWIEAIKYLKSK